MTVLFRNPEGRRRFRSNPLAVSRTWMVDRENLGDNNMSSEQVGRKFHRRTGSPHGLSHAVFSNPALFFQAKMHSERKHAYMPDAAHRARTKEKPQSYPSASGFRFHCQMLPKQCFSSEATPPSGPSSQQPLNDITLNMPWGCYGFHQRWWRGGESGWS